MCCGLIVPTVALISVLQGTWRGVGWAFSWFVSSRHRSTSIKDAAWGSCPRPPTGELANARFRKGLFSRSPRSLPQRLFTKELLFSLADYILYGLIMWLLLTSAVIKILFGTSLDPGDTNFRWPLFCPASPTHMANYCLSTIQFHRPLPTWVSFHPLQQTQGKRMTVLSLLHVGGFTWQR